MQVQSCNLRNRNLMIKPLAMLALLTAPCLLLAQAGGG